MKVLIIEDEQQAAQRLETIVKSLEPDVEILDTIDTVKRAVRWFQENSHPDIVFMDIQLADGISFSIFEQCQVGAPVIFTTAYDEYALKAFKVNSIDYILKPVDKDELAASLKKFRDLKNDEISQESVLHNIGEAVRMLTKKYKTRFVVKVGEHLRTVEVNDILYFYSEKKATFCVTRDKRNIILDYTLEQLEDIVDPERFYRINRQYLVSSESIQDIINYTNSRLKLILRTGQNSDIIVARERVQEFKMWLDR